MNAVLSIENDNGEGFREVGTEGRSIVREATRRQVINAAVRVQNRWGGRAVRVEEHDGSIYRPPSRVWTYHCACDTDKACQFHSELGRSRA